MKPTNERLILRGSSIWLVPLLEAGDADYAFAYESVARQHGVEFLELPPQIDLSREEYEEFYRTVSCKLAFQRFSTVDPEFIGQPIIYGLTIPENAPHPELAMSFIEFVLGRTGERIFTDNHQPLIIPPALDNPGNIPPELKSVLFIE
jgi:molybdate/tungstate transport system substrate-binding protein